MFDFLLFQVATLCTDEISVQVLLLLGARVNLRNGQAHTALHLAGQLCSRLRSSIDQIEKQSRDAMNRNASKFKLFGGRKTSQQINHRRRAQVTLANIITMLEQLGARHCPSNGGRGSGGGGCSEWCGKESSKQVKSVAVQSLKSFDLMHDVKCQMEACVLALVDELKDDLDSIHATLQQRQQQQRDRKKKKRQNMKSSPVREASQLRVESMFSSSEDVLLQYTECELPVVGRNNGPQPSCRRLPLQASTMLVLDGGFNEEGIKSLIQSLVLHELQSCLQLPLFEYFTIFSGTSYGGTSAAMLATGRSPLQVFSFHLQLRSLFRKPIVRNMNTNSDMLGRRLRTEFGDLKLSDVRTKYGKHLMLFSLQVDMNPAVLKPFKTWSLDTKDEAEFHHPLWSVCRSSGASLTAYTCNGAYYDGSICSTNPTLDSLVTYEWFRQERLYRTLGPDQPWPQQYSREGIQTAGEVPDPLGFVLSLGSGMPPLVSNIKQMDINNFPLPRFKDIVKHYQYFARLKGMMMSTLTQTDYYMTTR